MVPIMSQEEDSNNKDMGHTHCYLTRFSEEINMAERTNPTRPCTYQWRMPSLTKTRANRWSIGTLSKEKNTKTYGLHHLSNNYTGSHKGRRVQQRVHTPFSS